MCLFLVLFVGQECLIIALCSEKQYNTANKGIHLAQFDVLVAGAVSAPF